jgi:hypothetical protein
MSALMLILRTISGRALGKLKTGKVFNEFLVMCGRPNVCEGPEDDA